LQVTPEESIKVPGRHFGFFIDYNLFFLIEKTTIVINLLNKFQSSYHTVRWLVFDFFFEPFKTLIGGSVLCCQNPKSTIFWQYAHARAGAGTLKFQILKIYSNLKNVDKFLKIAYADPKRIPVLNSSEHFDSCSYFLNLCNFKDNKNKKQA
jgi:hypothetical protein